MAKRDGNQNVLEGKGKRGMEGRGEERKGERTGKEGEREEGKEREERWRERKTNSDGHLHSGERPLKMVGQLRSKS